MHPSPARRPPQAADTVTAGIPPMSPGSSGELSPFDLLGDIGDLGPGSPTDDGLDGNQNDSSSGQKNDSHTEIAEQAKHEAEIENRIAELRKEGFWTPRRLSKFPEPTRPKVLWDYLCEEMQWLAADFAQERRWKRGVARKVVRMVVRHHEELKQKEEADIEDAESEQDSSSEEEDNIVVEEDDDEFTANEEEAEDEEETIAAEEALEGQQDHTEELSQLAQEGEMSIEDLLKNYSLVRTDEEEMVEQSESSLISEQEASESSECDSSDCESEGVEFLVKQEDEDVGTDQSQQEAPEPKKEITDIATTGYTPYMLLFGNGAQNAVHRAEGTAHRHSGKTSQDPEDKPERWMEVYLEMIPLPGAGKHRDEDLGKHRIQNLQVYTSTKDIV
ncbi:uncharacterized protein LOC143932991 [Lithobates pipiens]